MCAAGVTRPAKPDRRISQSLSAGNTQSPKAAKPLACTAGGAPSSARWAHRPRPADRARRRGLAGSVAVGLPAARPNEGEVLAVLVVEEVGVDRRVEARIVQLDREIVAALDGALRPGRPDLGATDIDPMAGGVVVCPVGLGDDADVLGLDAQGDDLALELGAGLLEG